MFAAQASCAGDDAKPKGKPKAKAKNKGGKENPKAVWDVKRATLSSLSKPFPVVDRSETRKVLDAALLGKATWTVSSVFHGDRHRQFWF